MADEEKYISLGWRIIECKLMYYRADLVDKSWHQHLTVTDQQYDAIEDAYRKLCKLLNKELYAINMVGFDDARPSARLVLSKYSRPKSELDKMLKSRDGKKKKSQIRGRKDAKHSTKAKADKESKS